MRSKISVLVGMVCLFQSCVAPEENSVPMEDDSVVIRDEPKQPGNTSTYENTDTSIVLQVGGEEIELSEVREGVETAIEITQTLVAAGNEMLDAKRRKDSIQLSRREKMFVYQLGVAVESEKQALEAYEKLSDKEGIYAFKKGRKEYLLVKYQDKTEAILDKELQYYKVQHSDEVIGEIKKRDLILECGKKKTPRLTHKIKRRKSELQLDCLTCK